MPTFVKAERSKVEAIVEFLDADGNGFMDASEIKVLISKISGCDISEIPDEHPEVQFLANIPAQELVERLWENTDAELMDTYFDMLGLGTGVAANIPAFSPVTAGGIGLPSPEAEPTVEGSSPPQPSAVRAAYEERALARANRDQLNKPTPSNAKAVDEAQAALATKAAAAPCQEPAAELSAVELALRSPALSMDVVKTLMTDVFETNYNADATATSASLYTANTYVKVTGPNGAVAFEGHNPEEVAAFLSNLRNGLGATDMKFTITDVSVAGHTDTWDSASMTGTCKATWAQVDGKWGITSDMITFAPKAAATAAAPCQEPAAPSASLTSTSYPSHSVPIVASAVILSMYDSRATAATPETSLLGHSTTSDVAAAMPLKAPSSLTSTSYPTYSPSL